MNFCRFLLPLMLVAVAGCSSTPLTAPAPVSTAGGASPQANHSEAATRPAQSAITTVTLNPLDDPKSLLAGRSVYFDFDSHVVRAADRPLIDAHAKYLASSKTARLSIEGHGDERGGSEYNLALGQKRAEAVLKSLQLLGAPTGEMEAVSFGKERPFDLGHDENAWTKNRRADLRYVTR